MVRPYTSDTRPMVNEVKHNGGDEDQQRQQQHSGHQQRYLPIPQQVDVRMKRHPELHPFVPSDRDGTYGCNSGCRGRPTKLRTVIASPNDAKPSLTKPKKCVSMARLDQLARPKKIFTKDTINKPAVRQQVSQQLPVKQEARRVSLNDDHYQSAASELLQDNETSTNGLSISKNTGTLCNELEAELIAEGIVTKPELTKSNNENNHKSPALTEPVTETPKPSRDDEEKRLRAEEELKEFARREDQERQSRASIVDQILSRVQNQST